MADDDVHFMDLALREARRAGEAGEVPVGCVVVHSAQVIAAAGNRNLTPPDSTGHAEILALRHASAYMGNHRLGACTLYVTIEPCAMCAGALVHARIARLVYGAADPKAGAAGSVLQVIDHPALNHRMEVTPGVMEKECSAILQEFFRNRRSEKALEKGRAAEIVE